MIHLPVEQGSDAWVHARIGVVTASGADRILTPAKLGPSAQADGYADELLGEWMSGSPDEEFRGTGWTERGKALEPAARDAIRLETGATVEDAGICYRDDARLVACSPDGLVPAPFREGEFCAGVELKCPMPKRWCEYHRTMAGGVVPRAYRLQVQFSLWVTGLPLWYFAVYHPDAPLLLARVEPEAEVQAALNEHIPPFLARLEERRSEMLALGIRPRETMLDDGPEW